METKQSEQSEQSDQSNLSKQELVSDKLILDKPISDKPISDKLILDSDTGIVSATCPHCLNVVIIEQFNCCIFRHGMYKDNFNQIPPHLPKQECDDLKNKDLIFGCGKPFQILRDNSEPTNIDKMKIVICDYI